MSLASQLLPAVPWSNPLRTNLERVRERIAAGCRAAGRSPSEVQLLAVTKSVDAAHAAELVRLGQLDLGENRVAELERKSGALAAVDPRVRWHLIGHLQRNKARRAVQHAGVIHSVDSLALIETLARLASELGRTLDVFLEVRAIASPERSGFEQAELPAAVELAARAPRLRLRGLMALAELDPAARAGDLASQARARRTFAGVRELSERLPSEAFVDGRPLLSMGMSSDLEAAVSEGAHWVRVGTALFEHQKPEDSHA
ncbi:MAG: YggS family pyridoxal phosphate-dependent enzyme [Planctomycetes bacterium]|nr:YggS family pyridoxal phosphate-dependent enzyme [Planctomycetota bacterium]